MSPPTRMSNDAGRDQTRRGSKTCFVTIGATASFAELVRATLSPAFVGALAQHGYTELLVQYGADGENLFNACIEATKSELSTTSEAATLEALTISGFPVDTQGLDAHFRRLKKDSVNARQEGLVVSHAGTGTILAVMRMNLPIVVVPNEGLLDNHQVELAEALSAQGYVVHGRVEDLPRALDEVEQLRKGLHGWPPVNSGRKEQSSSIKRVLDEEMGFLD